MTVYVHKRDAAVEVPEGVVVRMVNLGLTPKPLRAVVFDWKLNKILRDEPQDLVISLGRTTCHDAVIVAGVHKAFNKALGRGMWRPSDWLQAWMDGRCYRAGGMMLPASEMIASQMVEFHGADASRMRMLYPPTPSSRFHQGLKERRQEFRKKYGFGEGKFSFLFISSNHQLKGLDVLMRAFELLPKGRAELLVAGPQGLPEVMEGVRYLGFVKETEELYAAGDCTLLASRYDAFGQVVTESLLCGTPVIVSGMTGAKAVVGPNEGWVVESFVPEVWAESMLDVMEGVYEIAEDFAERNGLGFEAHMGVLLEGARAGRAGKVATSH